ncbi:MAG: hypothetical protein ACOH5I_26565 [Oligoflexus sp.]
MPLLTHADKLLLILTIVPAASFMTAGDGKFGLNLASFFVISVIVLCFLLVPLQNKNGWTEAFAKLGLAASGSWLYLIFFSKDFLLFPDFRHINLQVTAWMLAFLFFMRLKFKAHRKLLFSEHSNLAQETR